MVRMQAGVPTCVGGMYGCLKGSEQTCPRAELDAIVEVLQIAVLPVIILIDHWNHVADFARGRSCCVARGRKHLDLWARAWAFVDDLGGMSSDLQVRWVKAIRWLILGKGA